MECMTDNRNRTVGEVRHAFSKRGGNLGTDGSVAYLFHKQGILRFTLDHDESALMDLGLDLGADDMSSDDQGYEVLCSSDVYHAVKEGFIAQGFAPDSAEITMSAEVSVTVDISGAEKMLRLLDILEDLDDVQKVYSNADIPDDILADLL